MEAMRYAVIYESGPGGFSAYVPDLPGCIATGRTFDEVKQRITEGIAFHLEGMQRHGQAVPAPSTLCDYVSVEAA